MTDVFTREKRSEVMSRIKGRGNRDTELALATILRRNRICGWRRHLPLTGRPDFAFPVERVAVFVDGCFWHRCPRCNLTPKQNGDFWKEKLAGNVSRDRRVTRTLRSDGWRVVRIWEHQMAAVNTVLRTVKAAIDRAIASKQPKRVVNGPRLRPAGRDVAR